MDFYSASTWYADIVYFLLFLALKNVKQTIEMIEHGDGTYLVLMVCDFVHHSSQNRCLKIEGKRGIPCTIWGKILNGMVNIQIFTIYLNVYPLFL